MQAFLMVFLTIQTAPIEKLPPFPCGRLDKRHLHKSYHAVSPPPALLCYDTLNIWSALYVLKHPVFHKKKITNQHGGQLWPEGLWGGFVTARLPVWLPGPSGNMWDWGSRVRNTLSSPQQQLLLKCPYVRFFKLSSGGNSLVIVGSSHQMRLSLCGQSPRRIIGNMLFISLPGMKFKRE